MVNLLTWGEVDEVRWLSPRMVRVVLGGPGLDAFEPTPWTDQYVYALFIRPGAPYAVPFDVEAARSGAKEHKPVGRRYTVRAWDAESRKLTLDFVTHGDEGYAGAWAASARPGDHLQFV